MDMATEIRVMLARENKNVSWLAKEMNTSQQNITNKMKRNNFRISEMIEISKLLGYELKIEFIKNKRGY